MQDLSNENIQLLQPSKLDAQHIAEQSSYFLLCAEKTSAEERIQSDVYAEWSVARDTQDVEV